MTQQKENLLNEVQNIKNTIDSQKVNAESLGELDKVIGITFHMRGYSVGIKSIDGADLKSAVDIESLKGILMNEYNSEKWKSKLNEAQAAADAAE